MVKLENTVVLGTAASLCLRVQVLYLANILFLYIKIFASIKYININHGTILMYYKTYKSLTLRIISCCWYYKKYILEITGFEPITLYLQSTYSSQLNYIPFKNINFTCVWNSIQIPSNGCVYNTVNTN